MVLFFLRVVSCCRGNVGPAAPIDEVAGERRFLQFDFCIFGISSLKICHFYGCVSFVFFVTTVFTNKTAPFRVYSVIALMSTSNRL